MEFTLLELLKQADRDNPISLTALCEITVCSDTVIRKHIADLRDKGHRICSAGSGYWLAKNEKDYLTFRKEYSAKIYARLRRLKAMDGFIDGQESIEGV